MDGSADGDDVESRSAVADDLVVSGSRVNEVVAWSARDLVVAEVRRPVELPTIKVVGAVLAVDPVVIKPAVRPVLTAARIKEVSTFEAVKVVLAGPPVQRVATLAALKRVVMLFAVQLIAAVLTQQRVVTLTTVEPVVIPPTVESVVARTMILFLPLIPGAVYVASPGPMLVSTVQWGVRTGMRGGMSVRLGAFVRTAELHQLGWSQTYVSTRPIRLNPVGCSGSSGRSSPGRTSASKPSIDRISGLRKPRELSPLPPP
jgi:hypothetical protein